MRILSKFGVPAFALICETAMIGMPAHAELLVMHSTAPALKAGAKLADGAKFNIPAGAQVRLQKNPAGTTYILDGPFDGTLTEYQKQGKRSWWRSLFPGKSDGPPVGGTIGGQRGGPPEGGGRGAPR